MFWLSKAFSAITQPLFGVAVLLAWGLWVLPRRPKLAQRLIFMSLMLLALVGWQPLPDALIRPLESSYPVPAEPLLGYAGLIVLGGALDHPRSFEQHAQVPINDGAERMTVPLVLMRQHTDWQLVFSGGEGRVQTTGITEAAMAKAFWVQQGLDPDRLVLENRSRTTRENAIETAKLLGADCQKPWLLLTSAWHMPRAMTEFEALGCRVTAYPVDFRTGRDTPWTEYSLVRSLVRWQLALHEWVGLWAYGLTR